MGQIGAAAQGTEGAIDGIVEHDLVIGAEGAARAGGRWPPVAIDICGELVVAALVFEIVRVGFDAVDAAGGDFADVGEAAAGDAAEHEEELSAAGEFVAPAVEAAVEVVLGVVPKVVEVLGGLEGGAAAKDEIGGEGDEAAGEGVGAAEALDAFEFLALDGPALAFGAEGWGVDGAPLVVVDGLDGLGDAFLDDFAKEAVGQVLLPEGQRGYLLSVEVPRGWVWFVCVWGGEGGEN